MLTTSNKNDAQSDKLKDFQYDPVQVHHYASLKLELTLEQEWTFAAMLIITIK